MKNYPKAKVAVFLALPFLCLMYLLGGLWSTVDNHTRQRDNARWRAPITARITNSHTTEVFSEGYRRRAVANLEFIDHDGRQRNPQRVMAWNNGLPSTTRVWHNVDDRIFIQGDLREFSSTPLQGPSDKRALVMGIAYTAAFCSVGAAACFDEGRKRRPVSVGHN